MSEQEEVQRPDLSVVIVNYNVRYFLEQCLRSVLRAMDTVSGEIIVVDNNSADGSVGMLHQKFGDRISIIANADNPGFSKANNQGILQSRGRYILLLNPDTVVSEDTFSKCIAFMDAHQEAGALGVRMIDGQGNFLPESKRSLPTAWVSFYKVFGLSALFPKSKKFGRYHLSYLDEEQTHEIEILSGAFMFLRREVIQKAGMLDEDFFMYGEDIDLSYRMVKAGYKNFYFPETSIIHYKGESTKKGSLNYVKVFYQAMIIFARKHFGGQRQWIFIAAIRLGVYLRATAAVLSRLIRRLGFPMIEGALIYALMYGIKSYWEHYVKYIEGGAYEATFTQLYMPVYTLVFVLFLAWAGAYKRPFRLRPLLLGPIWAFIAIATTTYMFEPIQNYSRAIVGLSAVFTTLVALATRGIINFREGGTFFFTEVSLRRVLLIGSHAGIGRLSRLIRSELDYPGELVGAATVGSSSVSEQQDLPILGELSQVVDIIDYYQIEELIFCGESVSSEQTMETMSALSNREIGYWIVPPDADFMVGSQAVYSSRYTGHDRWQIESPTSHKSKRRFDVAASLLLLFSFPILFFLYKKPQLLPGRLASVLLGKRHMVSYSQDREALPKLKPGLLSMLDRGRNNSNPPDQLALDAYYARTYSWQLDLDILLKGWRAIH